MIGCGEMPTGSTVVSTHLSGLDETDCDGDDLDQDDAAGIVVVLVSHPEGNSDKLKDIKWMENLERQIRGQRSRVRLGFGLERHGKPALR